MEVRLLRVEELRVRDQQAAALGPGDVVRPDRRLCAGLRAGVACTAWWTAGRCALQSAGQRQ